MSATGNITMDRNYRAKSTDGSPQRIFRQGETHAYNGTMTTFTGCGCNGTRRQVVFYKVTVDGHMYHVSGEFASANVQGVNGSIPSIDDRLENMGDGGESLQKSSEEFTKQQNAALNGWKLTM